MVLSSERVREFGLWGSRGRFTHPLSSPDYTADEWSGIVLRAGTRIYGGWEGQSNYYTDEATLEASGYEQDVLWGMLQVKPHPDLGLRKQVREYEVTRDIYVATGQAMANTAYGPGGGTQFFIPTYLWDALEPVDIHDLHLPEE